MVAKRGLLKAIWMDKCCVLIHGVDLKMQLYGCDFSLFTELGVVSHCRDAYNDHQVIMENVQQQATSAMQRQEARIARPTPSTSVRLRKLDFIILLCLQIT